MDCKDILLWFVTSFFGAGIVLLFDLWKSNFIKKKSRTEQKVHVLLKHLKDYGELTRLYRFRARVSSKVMEDENGKLMKDSNGKFIMENEVFEPEPRFEEAIKELKGKDLNTAVALKIVEIGLSSSEVYDITMGFDSSGKLYDNFRKLHLDTINSIEAVLNTKDIGDPFRNIESIVRVLEVADTTRKDLREKIEGYL